MNKFIKENWILISILFFAFPLAGVFSDEIPTLLASLKMIGQFSLRADFPGYYYPALLSYVYIPFLIIFLLIGRFTGLFPNLEAMKETVILNPGYFLPLTRFINVLLAVVTVFLVYKISLKLFNKKQIGLIAAWLLAVSFFHSLQSHFATTWIPQTFFIVLASYWAITMWQKDKLLSKDYVIGGLVVGAAFGINFVGIISYVFFILVHFWKDKSKNIFKKFIFNKKFFTLNLTLVFCLFVVYFLNPYGVNNYLTRITDTTIQGSSYKINESVIDRMIYYLRGIWSLEMIYFVFFIFAVFLLFKKEKKIFLFLFSFIIIYFLCLSPLTGVMQRYSLPILPFMIIMIAYFINWINNRWLSRNYLKLILILLITGPSLYLSLLFNTKIIQQDTRLLAQEWIYKNIPTGALINNVDLPKLYLNENKDIIFMIESEKPDLFSTKRKYLKDLSIESYPNPNYFVVIYPDLVNSFINQFEYIIIADIDFISLINKREELSKDSKKIKNFYPVDNSSENYSNGQLDRNYLNPWQLKNINLGGPYIEIYKVK